MTEQGTTERHRLDGRCAAVTGGLGLIGAAVCAELADLGARVLILDADTDRWQARRTALCRGARKLDFVAYDAAATDGIEARVAALEDTHGPVDVWINAAYPRTQDWGNDVENLDPESWRANVDMQLNAVCLTCNAVAARMAARGGGAIVNLGSIYGCGAPDFGVYDGTGMTMPPAYAAIKAGLGNYSRYLASYWGGQGVRVNVVCPGGVSDGQPAAFVDNYAARTPMRRMATPEEVAGPVAFLATDAAAYITGTVLPVDGGWTAI